VKAHFIYLFRLTLTAIVASMIIIGYGLATFKLTDSRFLMIIVIGVVWAIVMIFSEKKFPVLGITRLNPPD